MRKEYTGYYRTLLSQQEKERFKSLALRRGSVVDIHDDLIREFIRKEEEKRHGTQDHRAR